MAAFHDLVKQLVRAHEQELLSMREELEQFREATESRCVACPAGSGELGEISGGQDAMPSHRLECSSEGGLGALVPHKAFDVQESGINGAPEEAVPGPMAADSPAAHAVANRFTEIQRTAEEAPLQKQTSTIMVGNLRIRRSKKSKYEKWLSGPLESVMGFVIMLNVMLSLIQLQVQGDRLGEALYAQDFSSNPLVPDNVFIVFEHLFNAVFLLEFLTRVCAMRMKFLLSDIEKKIQWFNLMDSVIVLFCSFDLYLTPLTSSGQSSMNLMFTRMLRLARLARTLKVIQVLRSFSKLRILLKTVAASVLSFTWSMILLCALNLGGAIFICQMLQPAIADQTIDYDMRLWLFQYYGTAAKSVWTMFEFTFSGGWPTYARPVVEGVHWGYSVFFALYVSIVVFAVIRVVTALFLKDTLNVATKDADFMVQESMKAKKEYAAKLKQLFQVADVSGNGTIDLAEFNAICSIPEVIHYFQILELEISEVQAVFNLLDDGDGNITYEEFVRGIFRLKGTARSMDVLTLMRDCQAIEKRCQRLEDAFARHPIDQRCHRLEDAFVDDQSLSYEVKAI